MLDKPRILSLSKTRLIIRVRSSMIELTTFKKNKHTKNKYMKLFYIAITIEGKLVEFTGLYIFNNHKTRFITVSSPQENQSLELRN